MKTESLSIPRNNGKASMLNFQNYLRQICKYGIAGGIGACIDFGSFSLLVHYTPVNYIVANAISFSFGTLIVYYLQKNWTFKNQSGKNFNIFIKFLSVVIITYLLNNLILIVCIEYMNINPIIAKILQIFLSFMWGYSINKIYVFQ